MKKLNKLLVAGLTAAGLCAAGITTGAFAQTQSTDNDDYVGCPAGGPGPSYGYHARAHERWKDYHHQRRTALHDKLKLNAEQEKRGLTIQPSPTRIWKHGSRFAAPISKK